MWNRLFVYIHGYALLKSYYEFYLGDRIFSLFYLLIGILVAEISLWKFKFMSPVPDLVPSAKRQGKRCIFSLLKTYIKSITWKNTFFWKFNVAEGQLKYGDIFPCSNDISEDTKSIRYFLTYRFLKIIMTILYVQPEKCCGTF